MQALIQKLGLDKSNKEKKQKNKPGTRKPNLRTSNYFITINTNKSKWNMSEEDYKEFKKLWKDILDEFFNRKLPEFIELSNSNEENELYKKIDLPDRFETDTDITYTTEIGPQRGLIHAHGVIKMSFRALRVRINYEKVNKWLKEQFGYLPYFHAILFRDNLQNIMDYMQKKDF